MLATNSVSFFSSETIFISPVFLKATFAACRIWTDSYFLSALEKMFFYVFLTFLVSDEKFTVIRVVFPV